MTTSTTTPTSDLEDRLRSHYRTVASSMPDSVVEFAPRPVRRHVWSAIAMGTLAVAALAVVGLVIATHDTPSKAPASAVPGEFPLLVPGYLAPGLRLVGADDSTVADQARFRTAIYAPEPTNLGARALMVTVTSTPFDSWRSAGVATTVAGRPAVNLSDVAATKLVLDNGAAGSVAIAGRGMTSAEVDAVATTISSPSVHVADGPALATPPEGFVLVSDQPGPASIRTTELAYETTDGERALTVHVSNGAPDAFDQFVVLAPPGEPTEANELRAYRSVVDADTNEVSLAFELAPGFVVEVITRGFDTAELGAMATDLRSLSSTEWWALLATVGVEPRSGNDVPTPTTSLSSGQLEPLGDLTLADQSVVTIAFRSGRTEVCAVRSAGIVRCSDVTSAGDQRIMYWAQFDDGHGELEFGVLDDGLTAALVTTEGETAIPLTPAIDGRRGFAVLRTYGEASALVIRDADGVEVQRETVGDTDGALGAGPDTSVTPMTSLVGSDTVPCTEQQGNPPVTVVVACGG